MRNIRKEELKNKKKTACECDISYSNPVDDKTTCALLFSSNYLCVSNSLCNLISVAYKS